MSAPRKLGLPILLGVLSLFAMAPAGAVATLAFERGVVRSTVWVSRDDGSNARVISRGFSPSVSPDGTEVAFRREAGFAGNPLLMVAPTDRSRPPRRLLSTADISPLAWSPDSTWIAVLQGTGLGRQSLVVTDAQGLRRRVVARGRFGGFGFSPDGTRIVYSMENRFHVEPREDLYVYDLKRRSTVRLTHNQRSTAPVWGPGESIAFSRELGRKRRRYFGRHEIFLIDADGSRQRRLTRVGRLRLIERGLFATAWSPDGSQLLVKRSGQGIAYSLLADTATGKLRALFGRIRPGFVGTGFSADGGVVFGYTGGADETARRDVGTVPVAGGAMTILARNADNVSRGG